MADHVTTRYMDGIPIVSNSMEPGRYHYTPTMGLLPEQEFYDRCINQLRSYLQKLEDDGKMLRLKDIKKMDILDMTSVFDMPDNKYGIPHFPEVSDEEIDIIQSLNWYAHVPCFEKGALKLNHFRYIVFEILEMDPEQSYMKMKLTDYSKPDGRISIWQIGCSVTVETYIEENEEGELEYMGLKPIEKQNFEQLYTMYSRKDLRWQESDYQYWMDTVVDNAKKQTERIKRESGKDQCDAIVNMYMRAISLCNAMLTKNKPSRPIKQSNSGSRKVSYEKGAAPERKIRNVGALRVQSKDIPRKPCMETVITYRTAKWKVRGHIRHYKNGKEVYIKPTTHTRKALADTDKETATTIRFNKKKGK